MIADTLLISDKTELANILADKVADADDLIEALPEIETAGALEESILNDFIQYNWKAVLSIFDVEELNWWIEEKDYEAEWEQWMNECAEEEYELQEYLEEEYYLEFIEKMEQFRYKDPAERWGHPPKWRKS